MSINPIQGFYVHDEETNTDGIAKYDYKSLHNTPNIDDIEKIVYGSQSAHWEQGSLSSSDGNASGSSTRIRTSYFLKAENIVHIDIATGYNLNVFYFSDNSVFQSTTGFLDSGARHVLTASSGFIKIVIRKADNAAISPSDIVNTGVYIATVFGDASTLKNTLETDIKGATDFSSSINWESGSLSSSDGQASANTKRIRSSTILANSFSKISVNYGFQLNVFQYSGTTPGANNFISSSGFLGAGVEYVPNLDDDCVSVRLVIAKRNTDSTIGTSEIGNTDFSIYRNYSTLATLTSDIGDKMPLPTSQTPNIVYQSRNVDDTSFPPGSKWYIQASANNQYDRVRCDVWKTSDGEYVICHDSTINSIARNPDGTEISETITVSNKTLAELNAYDFGIKYGSQYAGANIPTLDEFCKWASLFNLGVTWHAKTGDVETENAIAKQLEILDKYGVTDNLIVITTSGQNIATMNKFISHNPRVSCYFSCPEDWFESNVDTVKSVQTDFNKVYAQLSPWGNAPTDTLIALLKANNILLYDSLPMTEDALLNLNTFNKGYSLIEANNVPMVKNTVRKWANRLVDA